eukprot:gnl/Chilomastix_cuspidata/1232.p1 GENE.gnl/Chilomastix_cuspidata/1232~~gnl/Chilomastix_cuspidata/1232.p1  ORF type:complete len:441 (-),score=35.83 gnl/Chilomastix_cuspidata/1232:292-1479(-)
MDARVPEGALGAHPAQNIAATSIKLAARYFADPCLTFDKFLSHLDGLSDDDVEAHNETHPFSPNMAIYPQREAVAMIIAEAVREHAVIFHKFSRKRIQRVINRIIGALSAAVEAEPGLDGEQLADAIENGLAMAADMLASPVRLGRSCTCGVGAVKEALPCQTPKEAVAIAAAPPFDPDSRILRFAIPCTADRFEALPWGHPREIRTLHADVTHTAPVAALLEFTRVFTKFFSESLRPCESGATAAEELCAAWARAALRTVPSETNARLFVEEVTAVAVTCSGLLPSRPQRAALERLVLLAAVLRAPTSVLLEASDLAPSDGARPDKDQMLPAFFRCTEGSPEFPPEVLGRALRVMPREAVQDALGARKKFENICGHIEGEAIVAEISMRVSDVT